MNLLIDAKPEAISHPGRLGRIKNVEIAGKLRNIHLVPLLQQNNIRVEYINGEEGHLIPRHLSNYKGWNSAVSRFISKNGSGGLLYCLSDGFIEYGKERSALCMGWLPPTREQKSNSYPRINVPSSIKTMEELRMICDELDLYYLTLYIRADGNCTKYSFGRYADIPKQFWCGWNKNKGKKINCVKFHKYSFRQNMLGENGVNLATHIRQELKKI